MGFNASADPDAARAPASLRRDSIVERQEPQAEDLVIKGLIEVGFRSGVDYQKSSTSDITGDSVQIDIEKKISEELSGRITLLYEDGGTAQSDPLLVDEAVINWGRATGIYFRAGKIILPSGNFASEFITDPVTQTLGEAHEHAVALGYRHELFDLQVFSYNGHIDQTESTDKVRSFGANLESEQEFSSGKFKASLSYSNNLGEADGFDGPGIFTDKNANLLHDDLSHPSEDLVVGADFENNFYLAHVEWLTALNNFDSSDLDWNGHGAHISALKLEAGLKAALFSKENVWLLGYQNCHEALALGLPAERWLIGSKFKFSENLELAYEYRYDIDYSKSEASHGVSGTGGTAQTHSVLLGLSF